MWRRQEVFKDKNAQRLTIKEVRSCQQKYKEVSINLFAPIKYRNWQEVKNYLQYSMSVQLEHLGELTVLNSKFQSWFEQQQKSFLHSHNYLKKKIK